MAKRKGSVRRAPSGPKEFDEKDGKLGPITTYEDVADEQDAFHLNRDQVMLDDGPEAKRQRKWAEQDAALEPSDEEVLGYDEASSEEEDDDEEDDDDEEVADEDEPRRKPTQRKGDHEESEEEEDTGDWGTSKKDYYNADAIETEADALEEEAEAKRLQQKRLQKMSEADFGFNEAEWLQESKGDEEGDVVTEVLKDVEITEDMGPEQRLQVLQTRYPEFDFLANEFVRLHPLLEDLSDEIAATGPRNTVAVAKSRALGAYIGALTMYFAILSSPAQGDGGIALDPLELRDHAVMDSLLQCRELWNKASKLQAFSIPQAKEDSVSSAVDFPEASDGEEVQAIPRKTKKTSKTSKEEAKRQDAAQAKAKARSERMAATEASLADLDSLVPRSKPKARKAAKAPAAAADSDSDFGEEETLTERAAAEKAAKKKSLRFYTSQIAQKANRRNEAGRDAGGDADLPYRERLRDRQARLNAEAEKRGRNLDAYGRGTALGEESGDEGDEAAAAAEVRGGEDEYYEAVAQGSRAKKARKAEEAAARVKAREAESLQRVGEEPETEEGKRAIGFKIAKNKGLTPKRKKEVRNPRVKKRMQFDEKKKKLGSMKAVYKGGEGRGGYAGEKTGIKTGLVKSVKL